MIKQVNKAAAEEAALISNMESLLDQLKQMSMAGQPDMVEEEPVAMAEDNEENMAEKEFVITAKEQKKEEEDKKEEDKMEKGLESTPSDSSTASDDAEERMDETNTELTEESVQEVAKAILQLSKKPKPIVKKSVNQTVLEAIQGLVKVQKANQTKISDLQESVFQILDGTGVIKQFEEVQKSQKSNKPKMDAGNTAILNEIKKQLNISDNGNKDNAYFNNSDKVRKNLGSASVLGGLLGKDFSRNVNNK